LAALLETCHPASRTLGCKHLEARSEAFAWQRGPLAFGSGFDAAKAVEPTGASPFGCIKALTW